MSSPESDLLWRVCRRSTSESCCYAENQSGNCDGNPALHKILIQLQISRLWLRQQFNFEMRPPTC